jgi:hypothetical protein
MTFDEAVNTLIEEAGMSKGGAIAEVRRYTQTPGCPLLPAGKTSCSTTGRGCKRENESSTAK